VVQRHAPIDTVRRTVTRATRPALIPLRAAASTLPDALRPSDEDRATDDVGAVAPASEAPLADAAPAAPAAQTPDAVARREELAELRDQLAAAPDLRAGASTERAQRATRSASAYLEARRARLRRELRELAERG
jgi:hypothetical protein